jgi:hypothetical protein
MFGGYIFPPGEVEPPYGVIDDWVGWVDFTNESSYQVNGSNQITHDGGELITNLIDNVKSPLSQGFLEKVTGGWNGLTFVKDVPAAQLPWWRQTVDEFFETDYLVINMIARQVRITNDKLNTRAHMGYNPSVGIYEGLIQSIGDDGTNIDYQPRCFSPTYGANINNAAVFSNPQIHATHLRFNGNNSMQMWDIENNKFTQDTSASGGKANTWDKIGFRVKADTFGSNHNYEIYEIHWLLRSGSSPGNLAQLKTYINNKYGTSYT